MHLRLNSGSYAPAENGRIDLRSRRAIQNKSRLRLPFRRWTRAVVFLLLAMLIFQTASKSESLDPHAQKIKTSVQKLGIGSKVKIERLDGTKQSGKIANIGDESFGVIVNGTGVARDVPYSAVSEARRSGLSRGTKIGIAVGVGAVVATGIVAAVFASKFGSGWKLQ